MKKFYWQKARILWDEKFPYMEGLFVWTRNDHPDLRYAYHTDGYFEQLPLLCVLTNLEPSSRWAEEVGLDPRQVERYYEFSVTVGKVKRHVWTNPKWKGAKPPKGFRKEDESNCQRQPIGISINASLRSITDVVRSVAGRTT